jgi:formamidopyrimidine-DNA glycosylase
LPELPEVEITARLISRAVSGAQIESVLAPGINALRSFDPPLSALEGARVEGVRRRGKLFLVDVAAADGGELSAVIHLMSAGRLQLFDKHASLRDRSSRLLVRLSGSGTDSGTDSGGVSGVLAGEPELRLREFGTKQAAWVKLMRRDELESDETLASLGPEAWPDPPAGEDLQGLLAQPRPLYALLRDQHVIAGIGRSWVDEILHEAKLSPFKRGSDLDLEETEALRTAMLSKLGGAIDYYEQTLKLPIPDKLPLPLTVHRQNGKPCPRCGTTLEAVFYEDYVMCYCPHCQTEDKVLKDRRLSRLLK